MDIGLGSHSNGQGGCHSLCCRPALIRSASTVVPIQGPLPSHDDPEKRGHRRRVIRNCLQRDLANRPRLGRAGFFAPAVHERRQAPKPAVA